MVGWRCGGYRQRSGRPRKPPTWDCEGGMWLEFNGGGEMAEMMTEAEETPADDYDGELMGGSVGAERSRLFWLEVEVAAAELDELAPGLKNSEYGWSCFAWTGQRWLHGGLRVD